MFLRNVVKAVLVVLVGLSSLGLSGCANNEARPAALTGEEPRHERHATGIDSQVNDK